jgi:hypothetical protein
LQRIPFWRTFAKSIRNCSIQVPSSTFPSANMIQLLDDITAFRFDCDSDHNIVHKLLKRLSALRSLIAANYSFFVSRGFFCVDPKLPSTPLRHLRFEPLESRRVLATTLGLGDIAFTGYQSTAPDKISIVLLKDVTAGTVITLTDNGRRVGHSHRMKGVLSLPSGQHSLRVLS